VYLVEQCPVEPSRVTWTVTLTNSYFRTAETFWESLAFPVELAAASGVIDHECGPDVSVPDTSASGRVATLMVTTLYGCGGRSTMAVQVSPAVVAPAGAFDSALKATAEKATALRTLPTFAKRDVGETLTLLTVPTTRPAGTLRIRSTLKPCSLRRNPEVFRCTNEPDYAPRACSGIDCAKENRSSGSYLLFIVANLARFDP
jgi:hypothetical protein